MTANITRYLVICLPPASNNIILTLKTINPNCDKEKVVEEFKLYSKEYIQYKALMKTPKYIKQRTSHIQKQGKDIQLKLGSNNMTFYYCYLYKQLKWKQELLVIFSRKTTVLNYLCQDYYIN